MYSVVSAFGTPATREYSLISTFWYSRYSRVLKSFLRLILQLLVSAQSFQLLVLQGLASTQVISASGTPATEPFKMTGTRESLPEYR